MKLSSVHINKSIKKRFKGKGVARLISDLVNPLFFPPLVLGTAAYMLGLGSSAISGILTISILCYTILPLLAVFQLLKKREIQSLDLPDRKSRSKLFLFTIFSAFTACVLFHIGIVQGNSLTNIISLIFLINLIIGYLINNVWKISIHAASVSTAGTLFLCLAQLNIGPAATTASVLSLLILSLLLPLMVWARYRLKIHTLAELSGGTLAGFLFTTAQIIIFTNLW